MAVELFTHPLFSDANLLAYYRLEGNSNDSKNSNNGTDTSMVYGLSYGKYNQGAQFASGRKIVTATSTALDANNLTVMSWVYFTGTNAQSCRIAERDSGAGATRLWIFGTGDSDNTIRFIGWNAAGTIYQATDGSSVSQNEWHLVGATWDGSFIRRYVDGQPYGTNLAVTGNLRGGSQALTIGNDFSAVGRHMVGNIDDLPIFSRALSDSEMSSFYNFSVGGGSPIFFGNTAIA